MSGDGHTSRMQKCTHTQGLTCGVAFLPKKAATKLIRTIKMRAARSCSDWDTREVKNTPHVEKRLELEGGSHYYAAILHPHCGYARQAQTPRHLCAIVEKGEFGEERASEMKHARWIKRRKLFGGKWLPFFPFSLRL